MLCGCAASAASAGGSSDCEGCLVGWLVAAAAAEAGETALWPAAQRPVFVFKAKGSYKRMFGKVRRQAEHEIV